MNPAASHTAAASLEPRQVDAYIAQAKEFFLANKVADLEQLLRAPNPEVFHAFYVKWSELAMNVELNDKIWESPVTYFQFLDTGLLRAQQALLELDQYRNELIERTMTLKEKVHVRLDELAQGSKHLQTLGLPRSFHVNRLLEVRGTVIRTGQRKLLNYEKEMRCTKCNFLFKIYADLENKNMSFPSVDACPNIAKSCPGKNMIEMEGEPICRDFQDIKVQERMQVIDAGSIPRSMVMILQDDLIDKVQAGDDVTVFGVPIRRWRTPVPAERVEMEIVFLVNGIRVNNEQRGGVVITDETTDFFRMHWYKFEGKPFAGRDAIIRSVCPQMYGLYIVKLALLCVMIGGVGQHDENEMKIRGESHFLMVGDPGTGKSQLLKYAAKLSPRAVLTTGTGTSAAGLTVTAIKDKGGEWSLEAGALVLADRGVCCIDEFSSISKHDKESIHEAMEQQTLSVAKAGLITKLHTRCTVIAATNPKGRYDSSLDPSLNTTIASPLLSRFDLCYCLLDKPSKDWDARIANWMLDGYTFPKEEALWSFDQLQAYVAYVKSTFQPKMSEIASKILGKYYQRQRQSDSSNAARTTVRMLESLIRLAEAHARLMFRNHVLLEDAVMAVALVENSISNARLLSISDGVTLQSMFPVDSDEHYAKLQSHVLRVLQISDDVGLPPQPPAGDLGSRVETVNLQPPTQGRLNVDENGFVTISQYATISQNNTRDHLRRIGAYDLDPAIANLPDLYAKPTKPVSPPKPVKPAGPNASQQSANPFLAKPPAPPASQTPAAPRVAPAPAPLPKGTSNMSQVQLVRGGSVLNGQPRNHVEAALSSQQPLGPPVLQLNTPRASQSLAGAPSFPPTQADSPPTPLPLRPAPLPTAPPMHKPAPAVPAYVAAKVAPPKLHSPPAPIVKPSALTAPKPPPPPPASEDDLLDLDEDTTVPGFAAVSAPPPTSFVTPPLVTSASLKPPLSSPQSLSTPLSSPTASSSPAFPAPRPSFSRSIASPGPAALAVATATTTTEDDDLLELEDEAPPASPAAPLPVTKKRPKFLSDP